jgi:hypothetical protein
MLTGLAAVDVKTSEFLSLYLGTPCLAGGLAADLRQGGKKVVTR